MLLDEFGQLPLAGDEFVEVGIGLGKLVVDFLVFLEDVDDFLYAFLHHLADGLVVVHSDR